MQVLYSLLLSETEFVPTLGMEYLLARLIENASGHKEKIKILTKEEMKILKAAAAESVREIEIEGADTKEVSEVIAAMPDEEFCSRYRKKIEEKAEICSRFSRDLLEYCFWDMDYELLDAFAPDDDFRESDLNLEYGILSEDEENDGFLYPKKWWKEKNLINRINATGL